MLTGVACGRPGRWLARAVLAVTPALAVGLGLVGGAAPAVSASVRTGPRISAGDGQTCAVQAGKAYCWGLGAYGGLGDGTTANSDVPVAVDTSGVLAGKTLTQVSTTGYHTCALAADGRAYCWGSNKYGELGDGTTASSDVPVAVDVSGVLAGKALTQISTGVYHTCALDISGYAYCWGRNVLGGLGDGTTADSDVPVAVDTSGVLAGKALTRISAGGYYTCGLDSAGHAYCWGDDLNGELGDGTATSSDVPVAVDTSGVLAGKTLTQLSGGFLHTCGLDTVGHAYCWGDNSIGGLGDGTTANSDVPVAVDTSGVLVGKTLTQISAGYFETCALDTAGHAYCWGDNNTGQLGDGTTISSDVPVAVLNTLVLAGKTLTQISAGLHVCALDRYGAAFCWGENGYGQLGDGTVTAWADDPKTVVSFVPQPPGHLTARAGSHTAAVSWTAPASLGTGTLTGYTATAAPGRHRCSTQRATRCTIRGGLKNGVTYTITVITQTTTVNSAPSTAITVTPHPHRR